MSPLRSLASRLRADEARRHFLLIVLDGVLWTLSVSFIEYGTVLPALAHRLTGSTVLVGVIACALPLGWQWPQLLIAGYIERRPRKMPTYLLGAAINMVSMLAAVALLFHGDAIPPVRLFWAVVVLLWLAMSGVGVLAVPWMDLTPKVVPMRAVPRLFAYRRLFGGVLGFGAGFVVNHVLSARSGLRFPDNYAWLFLLCSLAAGMAYVTYAQVREPERRLPRKPRSFRARLRLGPALMRADRNYRWHFASQCCLSLGTMCLPMLMPFALERLGAKASVSGVFVSATMLAATLSNIVWARLGDRRGPRGIVRATAWLVAVPPLIALLAGSLPSTGSGDWYADVRILVFMLTFMASGALSHGLMTGGPTYLLEIAPEEIRPTYVGFLSTIMMPFTALPILAGAFVARFSYRALFLLCIGFGLLSRAVVRKLGDPLPEAELIARGIDLGTADGEAK